MEKIGTLHADCRPQSGTANKRCSCWLGGAYVFLAADATFTAKAAFTRAENGAEVTGIWIGEGVGRDPEDTFRVDDYRLLTPAK